jgi:hypothetical protein
MLTRNNVRILSQVFLGLGVLSILGSFGSWIATRSGTNTHEEKTAGQQLANFIGLWPPTLFILSNLLDRYARERM